MFHYFEKTCGAEVDKMGGTEIDKFGCSIGNEGGDNILGELATEGKHPSGPILSSSCLPG